MIRASCRYLIHSGYERNKKENESHPVLSGCTLDFVASHALALTLVTYAEADVRVTLVGGKEQVKEV